MRGHQSIQESRLNGYHPKNVWVVLVDGEQPDEFNPIWDPELLLEKDYMPEIHIFNGDNIARADLRCLHGLMVHLVGQDTTKLRRTAKMLMRFKPAAVCACDGKVFLETHHTEN